MAIEQAAERCWVLTRNPPITWEPDEHEPEHWHSPAEKSALERAEGFEDLTLTASQLPERCWRVTCDGCGYVLDEEGEYRYCFASRAEAQKCAADFDWLAAEDGRIFCAGDDDLAHDARPMRREEIPGQMTLEGTDG